MADMKKQTEDQNRLDKAREEQANYAIGWGGSGAPMPINRDGADNNVRNGIASGTLTEGDDTKYSLEGNWKSGKRRK